jgi:hypothetical protein
VKADTTMRCFDRIIILGLRDELAMAIDPNAMRDA